ncbi:MAG: efflux RND transporter periplasmic adaptor subunit [Sulfuritalea sp.]|nr:efflux RND transporter periplasmic adaptor subunit [Sulfuritalea sp.]
MEMTDLSLIRRHPWKFLVTLLAVVALSVLAVRWWRGPLVAVETVVRRDFVQSVVASGHVETPHRVDVGAQITGTVVRVPVQEGQSVKLGDLLVELESAELRALQRQSEVSVVQAQARQRQVREVQAPVAEQALRQAQANLDNAKSTQRRNQDLFQKGFISEAALEQFRNTVDLADAQVRSTQKQLETARPAGSDSALAEAAVAEARASTDVARARSRYAAISAPVAGTLIGRNVEVGDVVQPGKVLMTLSPAGRTQLVVAIDEKNLHLLALGQKALASADAYPQQRFSAELVYVNPGVNVQTGAVQVKFDVPSAPAGLRQDMTVSVDIEVARRPAALLLPGSAVHDADGAAPWVLIVEDGAAVRRPIRLGLRSGGFVELLEGLREGDQVIRASAAVMAGTRVRATAPTP